MKFLTHSSLSCLALSCFLIGTSTVSAQGVAINPYPSMDKTAQGDASTFEPDQAVILELLARQTERKKRAESEPVMLGAPLVQPTAQETQALREFPDVQYDPSVTEKKKATAVLYQPVESPLLKEREEAFHRQGDVTRSAPEAKPDPFLDKVPLPPVLAKEPEPRPNYGVLTRKTIPITEWGSKVISQSRKVSRTENQPSLADTETNIIVSDKKSSILSRVNPQDFTQPEWLNAGEEKAKDGAAINKKAEPGLASVTPAAVETGKLLPEMPAPKRSKPAVEQTSPAKVKTAETAPVAPMRNPVTVEEKPVPQVEQASALPLKRKKIIPTAEPSIQPSAVDKGTKIIVADEQKSILSRVNPQAFEQPGWSAMNDGERQPAQLADKTNLTIEPVRTIQPVKITEPPKVATVEPKPALSAMPAPAKAAPQPVDQSSIEKAIERAIEKAVEKAVKAVERVVEKKNAVAQVKEEKLLPQPQSLHKKPVRAEQSADNSPKVVVADEQKSILSRVNPQVFEQPGWSAVNDGERAPAQVAEKTVLVRKEKPEVESAKAIEAIKVTAVDESKLQPTKQKAAQQPSPEKASATSRKRIIPTVEPSVQPALAAQQSILDGGMADEGANLNEAATFAPVEVEQKLAGLAEAKPNKTNKVVMSKKRARDLEQQVADLDARADTLPAMMQEQALKRGLQAQAGALVPSVERSAAHVKAEADLAAKIYEESDMLEARKEEMIEQQQAREEGYVMPVQPVVAVREAEKLPQSVPVVPLPHSEPVANGMVNLGEHVYASAQNIGELNEEFVDIAKVVPPQAVTPKWQAEKGQSAYKILSQWSRNAGVDLIWNSQFLVDLNEDIAVNGSYEEAVQAILSQYQGRSAGVHGSLFIDEVSGKKTLVIETNQS